VNAALVGGVALLLLVVLRGVWRPLFGPVLFYDLVRSARRGRYAALRCLYAGALLGMLFLFYAKWSNGIWEVFSVQAVQRAEAARFAEEFFYGFMAVQFVTAVVLTPALTGGALAEEKERRTLEFLFTTDLHSHEIVLGKLLSRLAFLGLLILTGLPVLSLLEFLGGVDPNLVLAGFAATAMTMVSLASVSLLNSAYARKSLTAIILTYIQMVAYLVLSGIVAEAVTAPAAPAAGPWESLGSLFCAGNPRVALAELDAASGTPGGVAAALPKVLAGYMVFHAAVALVALLAATVPLRVWTRRQASAGARRSFVLALTQRRLPPVGGKPMMWKELFAEPTFRFNRAGMVATATFLSVCFILGGFIEICLFTLGSMTDELPSHMNGGARGLGTFMACLLLVGVAVRAAGCLSGERARQTLEGLLSTPLANREILWAKWLGSVLCGRKVWWFPLVIWLAALFTGGLDPLALPLLLIAWVVYAIFLASLGVWFSLVSRNTLRATCWTLLTAGATWLGPWVVAFFGRLVAAVFSPTPIYSAPGRYSTFSPLENGDWGRWFSDCLSILSPVSGLYFLTFYEKDYAGPRNDVYYDGDSLFEWSGPEAFWVKLPALVFWLVCYTLAAVFLYNMARARFAEMTGRMPLAAAGRAPAARRGA
jgi:ABC-type transport system involved in multi-copper enzyme maturation permease subunit